MGITTCKWIIHVTLHDTYPGNEGTRGIFASLVSLILSYIMIGKVMKTTC